MGKFISVGIPPTLQQGLLLAYKEDIMSDLMCADVEAISAALSDTPLDTPPSDKGRYFSQVWFPTYHTELEKPVLTAIARESDPSFDRRVNVMNAALKIDALNGEELAKRGFSPSEITRYVTRAINKRLRQLAQKSGSATYFVIRNQKLTKLALEHKPA